MEMKKINSGKLRAAGYDRGAKLLRVQFDDGTTLEYVGIAEETWRRLSSSGSAWSFYRDNIEEEFAGRKIPGKPETKTNPLDGLFGKS